MKKTAQNDVTGDWIQSKPNSDQFGEGWDRIFGKKKALVNSSPPHQMCVFKITTGEILFYYVYITLPMASK